MSKPASRIRRVLDLAAVPPLHRARQPLDLGRIEAEGLADVAHGALRPVADHRRRERRAGTAVLRVEILDHLLAPLVLEVHVDVGGLVALARDEALEQHRHARRVHLGDAERVAGGGVRRRTASLAQDAAPARELDEVVHGQEIALVAELADQREFTLDELPDRRRRPRGPASHRARLDQAAQVRRRRRACRHDLLRILVAKLVERETAAPGDVPRRVDQRARVQRLDALERAQRALPVRVQRAAGTRDRRLQAYRGQEILERPAAALVHVHVAGRDRRQREFARERGQPFEPLAVGARGGELHRDPEPSLEAFPQPRRLVARGLGTRQPQHEAARQPLVEVRPREPVLALRGRAPALRNEARKRAVTAAAFSERDEAQAVREPELAADDERQAGFARGGMGPHDAGERTLVGQRERGIAERLRALDEFRRVRGAAQEREVADAMQLRVHRASAMGLPVARASPRGFPSLAQKNGHSLARGSPRLACVTGSAKAGARAACGRELRQHVRCATKRRAGPRASD